MTRRGRHRRRRGPTLRELAAVPVAFGVALVPADLGSLPPPIHVSVDGSVRALAPGLTLEEVRARLRLRPPRGNLLDVEGRVLRRRVVAGRFEVNDAVAPVGSVIRDGDRIVMVRGADRTEGTVREVREISGDAPADPQTHLASAPGEQVIVRGRISGKVVSSVFRPTGPAEQPPAVALTFDDGPSPQFTLKIARTLRRVNATATFFVVGYLVERYPDVVERLAAMGMAVGNHSQNHPYDRPFARLSRAQISTQVAAAADALEERGIRSDLFRPPGGSWSPRTVEVASGLGHRTVLWSVDSLDWTGLGPAAIASRVLGGVERGAIVLLHDGGGNRRATLQALPRIVRGLRERGLSLRAL